MIWSGVLIGASSLVLGVWQDWPGALLAAVVLGAGFGVYQAVDFALITQVLPGAAERAKDLGVINIASALPQVHRPRHRRADPGRACAAAAGRSRPTARRGRSATASSTSSASRCASSARSS